MAKVIAIVIIWLYLSHKYGQGTTKRKTRTHAKRYTVHASKPTQAQIEKAKRDKIRLAEQDMKQREQAAKRTEARQAARAEIDQIDVLTERYMNIMDNYETELDADTTPEKRQLQIMEKLTSLEAKIQKLEQRKAKCYYTMTH